MAPLQQQPSGVVLLVSASGNGTPTAATTTQRRGQTQDLWRAMYAVKGKGQEEEVLEVQQEAQQPMSKRTKIALVVASIVLVAAAGTCIGVALVHGRPGHGANAAPSAPVQAQPVAAPKPVVAVVPSPPPPPPVDPTKPQFAVPAGFKALWWDEFDGAALNTSKWAYVTPASQGADSEGVQKYTASPDNVRQEGGMLLITSLRGPDGTYTSGRLDSRPSGAWHPGQKLADGSKIRSLRVTASIQAPPPGQGIAGACWMSPVNLTYGAWPASGEIDVFGAINEKGVAMQGLHFGAPWPANEKSTVITKRPDGAPFSTGFSTFQLDWEQDTITVHIDGKETKRFNEWWTETGDAPFPAPFDHPFSLILNVAVGGSWPGPPDASTPATATMAVDYVRVVAKLADPATVAKEEAEEARRKAEEEQRRREEAERQERERQEAEARRAEEEERRRQQEAAALPGIAAIMAAMEQADAAVKAAAGGVAAQPKPVAAQPKPVAAQPKPVAAPPKTVVVRAGERRTGGGAQAAPDGKPVPPKPLIG